MNMIRRYTYPHAFLEALQQEILPLMSGADTTGGSPDAFSPKVDIQEDEKGFYVCADLPGVKPEDIEIEMDGNTLTLKGERQTAKEEKSKHFYRSECTTGKFLRHFSLPESVDSSQISAKSHLGVLTIHLPKADLGKNHRKIPVQQEDK